MPAVEDHVGVVARPVCCAKLQERFDLGLQRLQGHPTGGIVAAKSLNQVVGEKALHIVQHACRAPVQLLHLAWRQQRGLTVRTARQTKIRHRRKANESRPSSTVIQHKLERIHEYTDSPAAFDLQLTGCRNVKFDC